MIPVAFAGCAGMLHPAEGPRPTGRAVIICESFGYEGLSCQRAMLALARMCAAAGMTTLRFHYPGTGDSAGEEEPGQIDRWIDSIGAAARYLRESCGADEIALCGYRLGGLLAIEAAQRGGDIAALVLLAPVLAGGAHVRELLLSGAMVPAREGCVPPDWREILGYRLHAGDLARLRGLDHRAGRGAGAAPRVLLVSPDPRPEDLAPGVAFLPFQHFDGLTQHVADVVVPVEVFSACVAWLGWQAPPAARLWPLPSEPSELEVAPGVLETRQHLGPGGGCFGVLTRPVQPVDGPAVLIMNSGLNLHTGNGRGSVRLARRLAAAGTAALRIDLRKIGEAAPDDPRESVRYHDLARVGEVLAALDFLQAAGHTRVLLTGICAGAYIALHAAAGGDPRIRAAVLVNLPYFYIRDEDPAIPLWRRPLSLSLALLHRTRHWRANHGPNRRAMLGARYFRRRYLASRVLLECHHAFLAVKHRALAFVNRLAGRALLTSREERLLAAAHAAGVRLTLLYSRGDWGIDDLTLVFGPQGQRLVERGWADLRIMDEADHTMTARWMQDAYDELVEAHLAELQPSAAIAEPAPAVDDRSSAA
ncbi:hypothetical protein ACLBXM_00080 [Xanthobacteraceae bacterium A53D]